MEDVLSEKVLQKLEEEKIYKHELTEQEQRDVLGAINIVVKNLDATQLNDLERFTKLFKKLSEDK